jgi:hypothetical protein
MKNNNDFFFKKKKKQPINIKRPNQAPLSCLAKNDLSEKKRK